MSQVISINLARPGLRLAADLIDAGGQRLGAKGDILGPALLGLARERGVSELCVELAAAPAAAQSGQARLEHLFRRAGSDATTQALLRTMIEYREERPK